MGQATNKKPKNYKESFMIIHELEIISPAGGTNNGV
jgi:hypothetical protein